MADSEDNGGLFGNIIGDMKTMGPLWEDLLLKASKFYTAVKQTAVTADAFLDSFQKIADATTNSKGATRDIGVSFTKIVLRHKAIEMKLKTYVGILADSFVTPLQDVIDEWKKNCSQLEKDHHKDYKRLKGELKRANADALKLKKKASKKIGKQEYTEQFRDAMKTANQLYKSLEEQEKSYLRKLMIEERSRAAQFFKCYKPCVEQELTLIAEIEHLQSIVDETDKQCATPTKLPEASEDAINGYKVPEYLTPGSKDSSCTLSPPSSPLIVKDRTLSVSAASSKNTLTRSGAITYTNGPEPIRVNVPMAPSMAKSPSISSRSSYSSSSSIDQQQLIYDPVTLQEVQQMPQQTPPTLHDHSHDYSNTSSEMANMVLKPGLKTRTSWSSIETSDSSGIGSYNSLTNKQYSSNSSMPSNNYTIGSDTDPIEHDFINDVDLLHYPGYNQKQEHSKYDHGFHQVPNHNSIEQMKYATIDRSHFRKNYRNASNFRDFKNIKPRSNSLDECNEDFPPLPDYKMNLPKSKTHTISGHNPGRPSVFQVFNGRDPGDLIKKLNPTISPHKQTVATPLQRRNSSPSNGPRTAPKPKGKMLNRSETVFTEPKAFTIDNDPDDVTPGSFQEALLRRRRTMRSLSVDQSTVHEKYR